jgi:hypothetical protein
MNFAKTVRWKAERQQRTCDFQLNSALNTHLHPTARS